MRPRIHVIATGGTIAGAAASAAQTSGYTAGAVPIATLLGGLPDLSGECALSAEQPFAINSKDIDDGHWLTLRARVAAALADPEIGGVVIPHGTDTIEETAFFLDLALGPPKPVVMVGAMRPASALSADGPMNLLAAIRVAADARTAGRGVLILLNDTIHAARDATKRHTANVAAFDSGIFGPVGSVQHGIVRFARDLPRSGLRFDLDGQSALPAVDIIYGHAGMSPHLVEAAAAHAAGIVYAGTGDGSIAAAVQPALIAARQAGCAIVRASRVGGGAVSRNEAEFIIAGDLTPQKARVLLRLALTRTRDQAALQAMFDRC